MSSLGEGRRFVAKTLRDWNVDEDTIEPVMLVANELVANAIVHAHSSPVLSLGGRRRRPAAPRRRRNAGRPIAPPLLPGDDGGRGLMLVEALCDRWGVDASGSGKSVWVTFAGTFG